MHMKLLTSYFIGMCAALLLGLDAQSQMLPKYEFRAVWIATVENIDWPSQKGLSSDAQKAEFIQLLNLHQRNGMNAIIMQIRPSGDAFYPSALEPWSEYLTGVQGKAPEPYYDPLQFMIAETHKRGMEFHAWLNPYRAVFNIHKSSVATNHVTKTHPEWFLVYGNIKYFNPGLPQVRSFVGNVVKEIVEKYDVDAIHMDDYFYPYRIPGKEFPDEATYRQYGNGLSKADWRRSNCDSIIKQLYTIITATNGRIKFGISPFGVWRNQSQHPDGSSTKAGTTNYDDLYADILLWLKEGWVDYVVPQLYWERGHKLCDFDTLVNWWANHNYGKQMMVGHGIYRGNSNAAWRNKSEIPNQINIVRNHPNIAGSAFFSSKTFETNTNGWNDTLRNNCYALPALVPPMPWIDSVPPAAPMVKKIKATQFVASYSGEEKIKGFAIFSLAIPLPENSDLATLVKVIPTTAQATIYTNEVLQAKNNRLFVATIDENNNVGKWVELK
jgi:uncharacterized lipoprotein YddW (UPF0748 family)